MLHQKPKGKWAFLSSFTCYLRLAIEAMSVLFIIIITIALPKQPHYSQQGKTYLEKNNQFCQELSSFSYFIWIIIVIVMLSNYLRSGQAHFSVHTSKISLSFIEGQLRIDSLPQQYQKIKSLSLTYCNMSSLQGIQQFQCLEQLNIRCNCITEVGQLLRIKRKELIQRLQFVGNDIEYLGSALFINLQPHFPNLIELNGKNYMKFLHKPSDRRHQMKKIIKQAHGIQKELMKTLKKEGNKVKQFRRELGEQALQTEHNYYVTQQEENENLPSRSKEGTSSRQRSTKQQSPSPARSRPPPSPHRNEQQKENHNNSNHQEYDVSLSDISNIPMTKSVRGSFTPLTNDAKQNKRRGLQIFTLNQSHNKLPLSQPTATFAMQREKENQDPTGLMFRNREKTQKYKPCALPIEECVKEDFERPTKRQTYQSVSDQMNESWSSSFSRDNIIHEDKTSNQIKKIQLAGALFTKNLLEKVFYAWQVLPAEKNFPVKRHFL